jgi:hypothetical protein
MIYHARGLQADPAIARLSADGSIDSAVRLVDLYAFRKEADNAFHWLHVATDRSFDTEHVEFNRNYLAELSNSPFVRFLHDDPRWQEWQLNIERRTLYALSRQELAALH